MLEWNNGSTDWVASKDPKEFYPVDLAIYATNREIQNESTFAWWVTYVLEKQKQIL